jgi:phosphoenolpyruvate synthase/pyruvate phosphate dikinase
MTVPHKYVYLFANGVAEGKGAWRDLLGGKGAGLAEMTALGIRVPPGCTISTEACRAYYASRRSNRLLGRRLGTGGGHCSYPCAQAHANQCLV